MNALDLSSAYVKIERGREHLAALNQEAEAFFGRAYRTEVVEDEERRTFILRVEGEQPARLAAIAGDAAHNMRSALDHAVCALVRRNGETVTKDHSFPIVDTERGLSASYLTERLGGAGDAVIAVVKELRPWRAGNLALWQLHRLDIEDKHRLLPIVALEYRSFAIDGGRVMAEHFPEIADEIPSMPIALRPAERLFKRLIDGTPLFSEPKEGVSMSPQFNFELALEAGGIDPQPTGELLSSLAGAVETALHKLSES